MNFVHLALVDNPRYERANIVFNSKTQFVTVGEGESAHVIPAEYLNENKQAKQYGGLSIDEYNKKIAQYSELKKKNDPTPQDNKTMRKHLGYMLEDELYNLANTEYNNDFLKNVQLNYIQDIKKKIKELDEWFDLSKTEKKHMSKSWLDYLEKHPEEFKNSVQNYKLENNFTEQFINIFYEALEEVLNTKTVNNYNPNHGKDGKFCSSNGVNPNYKKELKQVIDKAKNNPNERQKLVIGKVSDELVKKAKDKGFDIEGYNHDLDVSGTRHSFKNHGNGKKEEARGQIPITDEDFERIPQIVYDYDDIKFGEFDEKGTPLIKYHKSFTDGTSIYAEEIRTRQKTLTIKSLYKRKNKNADNSCTFTDFNPQRPEYISNIIINDINIDFNPSEQEHEEKLRIDNFKDEFIDAFYQALAEVTVEKGEG